MSYALKNYNNSEIPPNNPAPENGDFDPYAAYGSDPTDDLGMYGEEQTGDGVSGYEGMGDAEDLKSYLKDLKESVKTDSTLDSQAKSKLLAEISQAMLKVNQGQVGSTRRQETLMSEVEAEIANIEGELAIQPALKEANVQIETLKKKIEDNTFSSDYAGKKSELLEKLGKAQSDLDLNGSSETLAKVQETLTAVQDDLDETVGMIEDEKQTNLDTFNGKVDELKSKIDASKELTDDQKKEYRSELETQSKDLRTQLENGTIKLEDAEDGLNELDRSAGEVENNENIIGDYDLLSHAIPSGTHNNESSKYFAREMVTALKNKNWDKIKDYLDFLKAVGEGQTDGLNSTWNGRDAENYWSYDNDSPFIKADGTNDVIMNFTGVLFYKVADQDKNKLKELLSSIDGDVLRKMKAAVLANRGEVDDTQGYNTDTDKESYGVYGTPNDVGELIDSVLSQQSNPDKNKHRLGETQDSAPSTSSN